MKTNKTHGFTLQEILLVIAIMGILFSVAFVGVSGYRQKLQLEKMNHTAKDIFLTSSNAVARLDMVGEWQALMDQENGGIQDADINKYFSVTEGYAVFYPEENGAAGRLASQILPEDMLSKKDAPEKHIVIVCDAASATVCGVWYTEDGVLDASKIKNYIEKKNTDESRVEKGFVTGYYGGKSGESLKGVTLSRPRLQVTNGDKLQITIENAKENLEKAKKGVSYQIVLTGKDSKKEKVITFCDTPVFQSDEKKLVSKDKTTGNLVMTLDAYGKDGKRFQEICEAFFYGEDISCRVSCRALVSSSAIKRAEVVTNPLFASVVKTPKTCIAQIGCWRHLKNLDVKKGAYEKSVISEAGLLWDLEPLVKNARVDFSGITNDFLKAFHGNGHAICNLTIGGGQMESSAGLFRKASDLNIDNLTLKDVRVEGHTAGGFVGSAENVSISNCAMAGKDALVKAESGYASGGLIGDAKGRTKVSETFSVAKVEGKIAGGLIGNIQAEKESTIENCYVGGRTLSGGSYDPENCNAEGQTAGGFIGKASGDLKIKNCYTTASAKGSLAGGFIGEAGNVTLTDSYATGLVKGGKKGAFLGKSQGAQGKNNFVLSGVNALNTELIGEGSFEGVEKGRAEDIRGEAPACQKAHPFDKDLKEDGFLLRTVTGKTHYGDWPESQTKLTITKKIVDKAQKEINRERLAEQNLYFTLTNKRTNQSRDFYYKDAEAFTENSDGTYAFTFQMPAEEVEQETAFVFNETHAEVQDAACKKTFTVKKNDDAEKKMTQAATFQMQRDDQVEILVINTYARRVQIVFQGEDRPGSPEDMSLEHILTKVMGSGENIQGVSRPWVPGVTGYRFTGRWILTDKTGKPVDKTGKPVLQNKKMVRINAKGFLVTKEGQVTKKKFKVPDNVEKIYFTAEYEKLPVVTLQYGIMEKGKFIPLLEDQTYYVEKGTDFKEDIAIKDVLNSVYEAQKVEPAKDVTVSGDGKHIRFNVPKVSGDKTYRIIVDGKETAYGVKLVFENSQGTKIDALAFKKNGKAEIASEVKRSGVAGCMTNIARSDVKDISVPDVFDTPSWTNVPIQEKGRTFVEVIYPRKSFDVTYSLAGGRSQEGNTIISRCSALAESPVTLPQAPERQGYTFRGWQMTWKDGAEKKEKVLTENTFTMPKSDVHLTALWEENTTADYTIEFYVQKVSDAPGLQDEDKHYDYFASKTVKNAVVGEKPPLPEDYKAYGEELGSAYYTYNSARTEENLSRQKVKPDGSTVIKVYYDREEILMNFLYQTEAEAAEASKKNGGQVAWGLEFVDCTYMKATPGGLGWYYWRDKKYQKITEETRLKDSDPVYYRYYWGTEKYYETTYSFYKTHLWKWDRVGALKGWYYGYYENNGQRNNVVYKGLYGAPFKQKEGSYYNFSWNADKNWVSHAGSLFNFNPQEISFYDCFKIPSEEGNEIVLHAHDITGTEYQVRSYIEALGTNEWIPKNVLSSKGTFTYQFANPFEGFTVRTYNFGDAGGEQKPIESGSIKVGSKWGDQDDHLNVFYKRNAYPLYYKNICIEPKNVLYEDAIKKALPGEKEISGNPQYIPDGVDSDFLFDGWYDSLSEDASPISESALMPAQPFTVFAHWRAPEYQVRVHYKRDPSDKDWTETKAISVPKYATAESHEALKALLAQCARVTNADYIFDAWHYEPSGHQVFDPADPVLSDTDLYAAYEQKRGFKKVKVRYTAKNASGETMYFQVDRDGNVLYDAKGNVSMVEKDAPDSFFELVGELKETRTVSAPVVKGFRPQQSETMIAFRDALNEVEIPYNRAETWSYTVLCQLKDGTELSRVTAYTSDRQVVLEAPAFNGFTICEDAKGFRCIGADAKNKTCVFTYTCDEKYDFHLSGDYVFSSDSYATAKADGRVHSVSVLEKESGTLPENAVVSIKYFDLENGKSCQAPQSAGQYYAEITVKIGERQIGKTKKIYLVLQ